MSDTSWHLLVDAHRQAQSGPRDRLPDHQPKAAILACSDARVPPSVVFNQPAGNLFVIRIAGNTAVPSAIASLDYAVDKLGVDLIVVMGHTHCGAVQAATAGTCGGHLEPIVAPICQLAAEHSDLGVDEIAALNVANTVSVLMKHDGPVGRAVAEGNLEIRGAIHDLETGQLLPVPLMTNIQQPRLPMEAK